MIMSKALALPKVLRIEPASSCNLACSHCPTGTVDIARTVMSEDVFDRILEDISGSSEDIKVVVLYHGGEPLLNKDFFRMVTDVREILPDAHLKTVSNGMALTKKNVASILESSLDAVEFSLDAESAAQSQFIRRNSDTEKIVKNIKHLLREKKRTNSSLSVAIATTQFVAPDITFPISAAPVPKWLREIFSEDEVPFKTTWAMRWPHMLVDGFDLLRDPSGKDLTECDHVENTITVRADGEVVPCCYDLTTKLSMGNINNQSLLEIWNGKKYARLRESFREKKYIGICSKCAVVKPPEYLIPTYPDLICS
tara:strand:- start:259 stop:1191 length:933 start_codon:yes stop_codon:yes gene_type:complete